MRPTKQKTIELKQALAVGDLVIISSVPGILRVTEAPTADGIFEAVQMSCKGLFNVTEVKTWYKRIEVVNIHTSRKI